MPTSQFHIVSENEVVANKGSVTCTKSCREALVVSITQPNDSASLGIFPSGVRRLQTSQSSVCRPLQGYGIHRQPRNRLGQDACESCQSKDCD